MLSSTISLTYQPKKEVISVKIPSSKSISNRWLMLKEIVVPNLCIQNLSTADDTQLLLRLLSDIKTANPQKIKEVNAQNCGTAFRFLCTYLCLQKGKWFLTGNNAMKSRPIKALVDVLLSMDANIQYLEKEGFPPLLIEGSETLTIPETLFIDSHESSQFVSAFLLILPLLKQDITLRFSANTASLPYIQMTLSLMQSIGINISCQNNDIAYIYTTFFQQKQTVMVESDWSSAAYWFAWTALHPTTNIVINNLKKSKLQVDSIIEDIVIQCGVEVNYQKEGVFLRKTKEKKLSYFQFDARACLDLIPTLAVLCCGLKINASISSVENLKYKESNRIEALMNELGKIADIQFIENNLVISPSEKQNDVIPYFHTYNDHRLAMSFALLSGIFPEIHIENPACVNKSYPEFWENMEKTGVKIS